MLALLTRAPTRMRVNFTIVCLFLAATMIFGGASRSDVQSLPVVRLTAIAMIAIAAMQIDREQWMMIRVRLFFLLAIAAVVAVQLIPLPPQTWASLPGRSLYLEAMTAAGVDDVWRPLSLTPDLTLNTLLAVLPPLATILALGTIDRAFDRLFVPLLLIVIAVNAVVGLLQVASNGLYFYSITNEGAAVGFFSNRNHFAVMLAIGFPCLACWAALPHPDPAFRRLRRWLALCAAAAIFPILLATGSRAGLILGVIAALISIGLALGSRRVQAGGAPRPRRRISLLALLPFAVGVVAILATIMLSRDAALHRLLEGSEVEHRAQFLPIYVQMVRDFFPVGSGFGSFDSVFRAYEPASSMIAEYLNHAHNDLAQILIEGGLPAGILLVTFLFWFVVRSVGLWFHGIRTPADLIGRTGSAVVLLLLLSSLVDYPLRTPWMAALMAIACGWMAARRDPPRGEKMLEKDGIVLEKDGIGSHSGLR
jgi:O-antigen ligase